LHRGNGHFDFWCTNWVCLDKASSHFLGAALSLVSLVMQNQKKYADCADLHFKWNRLAGEYKALWNGTYADSASATLPD